MKEIMIGNIKSKLGDKVYGFLDVLEHPIGTVERLPVIIAQGKKEGPTFWITANIHGDEYTGIPVIHKLMEELDLEKMCGTIVAIPSLNPAGSRTTSRFPYYDRKDPNRLFPDGNPNREKTDFDVLSDTLIDDKKEKLEEDIEIKSETKVTILIEKEKEEKTHDPLAKYDQDNLYPSTQELIWKELFRIIKQSADYLIDLHNAFLKSIPFIFLDRVLYNEDNEESINEAKKLYKRTEEMVQAFGLTIVRETTPKKYVQKKLHRSTSGAALNYLRIPSFTVELGMNLDPEPEVVSAAVIGIQNALKSVNMIEGDIKPITTVPVVGKNEAIRYVGHPRIKNSAIIELKVKKGDFVKSGDIIAIARDVFGRKLPEGEIRTEIDGYVFMINDGILRYPNEEICWIASNDVHPMLDKWPKN